MKNQQGGFVLVIVVCWIIFIGATWTFNYFFMGLICESEMTDTNETLCHTLGFEHNDPKPSFEEDES